MAALLAKKQGYDVYGVYILGWLGTDRYPCHWQKEEADARQVAEQLGIPFETVNLSADYFQAVIQPFFDQYQQGQTPNPDILCNQAIKFGALYKAVRQLEPDLIITGHYAKTSRDPKSKIQSLAKAKDLNKDQSYFLWAIDRAMLDKVELPIGTYTKSQVRQMAKRFNLPTAEKKDSQGICFIGPLKVRHFLKDNLKVKPGEVVDLKGEKIAEHQGVQLYTIGQRLGAGSVSWTGDVPPLFVVAKDLGRNRLIVGSDKDCQAKELVARQANWLIDRVGKDFSCLAKVRYRQEEVPCRVKLKGDQLEVKFPAAVRALSVGQSIVFYDSMEKVLGGAWISAVPEQERIIAKING